MVIYKNDKVKENKFLRGFGMRKLGLLGFILFVCCTASKDHIVRVLDPQPDALPPGKGVGVVLLGDAGTGDKEQYKVGASMAKYCEKNDCDFGLLLGDNIYEFGVRTPQDSQFKTKFEKPYADLKFPFYVALGNHDAYGCWICQVQYKSPTDKWIMPAQYYSFKKGDVEFFGLDTTWGFFRKGVTPQHTWLENSLKASTAKWKIVFGHHPVYSSGYHGGDGQMQKYLLPMLKKYDVDFYVAGHDHHKELIQPYAEDQVKFIISGVGAKLRSTGKGTHTVFGLTSLGFGYMLLEDDKLTLRFVGLDGLVEYEKVF